MSTRSTADAERRHSPRFVCGGQVQISFLPSNGIYVPGKMRDLSLGGCCFDTALRIDCGTRAEVVVRANSASFRVIGELKEIRDNSLAGLEFVRLSTAGKDMLAELIAHLARVQRLRMQIKSARDGEAEVLRDRLEEGRSRAARLYEGVPSRMTILPLQGPTENVPPEKPMSTEDTTRKIVVPVDLFG